jgi:hypothetical protein
MSKNFDQHHDAKKKPMLSLKEKRLRKREKKAAKQSQVQETIEE